MPMMTLPAAAKAAGVSRTTIVRKIKEGRLSATIDDDGSQVIDPAELSRVYPAATLPGSRADQAEPSPIEHVAVLRERIRGLETERDIYRRQLEAAQSVLETIARLPPPVNQADREPAWFPVAVVVVLAAAVVAVFALAATIV